MTSSKLAVWARVTAVLLLVGCGGKKTTPLSPTPILLGIFPSHATAGGPSFPLSVSGLQLISTSVVNWNGQPRSTTLDQKTGELTAMIKASDIAKAGTAEVTIANPSPGGGSSGALTFFIDPPPNRAPTISSLSPPSAMAGGAAFTLTVNGAGFVSISAVNWNGQPRPTTFESSAQLKAQINKADIANPGTAQVTVTTPAPGGGVSNSFPFSITATTSAALFPLVVSVNAAGRASSGRSFSPRMDGTGRFVAFASDADDLVEIGNSGSVFVRDTCLNAEPVCMARTIAVDLAPDGGVPEGRILGGLDISADGRYVAFTSIARDLIQGGTHSPSNVFLRDTCLGLAAVCCPHTMLLSVDSDGNEIGDIAGAPSISSDGRFIAFAGRGATTVSGTKVQSFQVYVRDTCLGSAGAGCAPQTIYISTDFPGRPGDDDSLSPSISKDGRYVAFVSRAGHPGADGEGSSPQVFLRDTCMGVGVPPICIPSTTLISTDPDGRPGDAESTAPSISADGRFVTFYSAATNLAQGTGSGGLQIILRDNCVGASPLVGCRPSTVLISVSPGGEQGNGPSLNPEISASGRFIVFSSTATNLVSGVEEPRARTYVRDTCFSADSARECRPQTFLVSVSTDDISAMPPNPEHFSKPVISARGDLVAFDSAAKNVTLPEKVSGKGDVFLTRNPLQ